MTVCYKQYTEDKKLFFEKHNYNYTLDTSSMDEFGRYTKTYMFEDGSVWYEVMSPTLESTEVEIRFVKIKVEVKMLRTEYWSSESSSKFYYEKF